MSGGSNKANYVEVDDEDMLLMAFVETKITNDGVWFMDSRCSNHMCGNKVWFSNLNENFRHQVKLGNNYRIQVMGKGDITVIDVYYVPELCNNMMSIRQLQERGVAILMQDGYCKVYHPRRGLILQVPMTRHRMFALTAIRAEAKTTESQCLQTAVEDVPQLWHQRYAHLN